MYSPEISFQILTVHLRNGHMLVLEVRSTSWDCPALPISLGCQNEPSQCSEHPEGSVSTCPNNVLPTEHQAVSLGCPKDLAALILISIVVSRRGVARALIGLLGAGFVWSLVQKASSSLLPLGALINYRSHKERTTTSLSCQKSLYSCHIQLGLMQSSVL